MTKMKTVLLGATLTVFIFSCSNNSETKTATTQTDTAKKIDFPFSYVDTRKEDRKNDNSYNEMLLYTCGDKPSLDTLKLFCTEKKNEFKDGVFHIIIFFDKKQNATFPNNPVTALYIEDKPMKHIKAIYTFNKANGYSQLDFYEKNSFESSASQNQIN
jgi:hypothetical protein